MLKNLTWRLVMLACLAFGALLASAGFPKGEYAAPICITLVMMLIFSALFSMDKD